jgi:hypothetical protein
MDGEVSSPGLDSEGRLFVEDFLWMILLNNDDTSPPVR